MSILTKRVVVVIICALIVSSDAGPDVQLRGAAHRVALDDRVTSPDDESPPMSPPDQYDTYPGSELEEDMGHSGDRDPSDFSTWTPTETSRKDPWEIELLGNEEEQHDNQMPSPNNLQFKPTGEGDSSSGKPKKGSSSGVMVASSNQEIDPNAEIPVMEPPVVEDPQTHFNEEYDYYPELPVTGDETVLQADEEYYSPAWDEYASASNGSKNDEYEAQEEVEYPMESFNGDEAPEGGNSMEPLEGAMEAPEGEGAMEAPEGEGAMEAPEGEGAMEAPEGEGAMQAPEGAGNEGLEDVVDLLDYMGGS